MARTARAVPAGPASWSENAVRVTPATAGHDRPFAVTGNRIRLAHMRLSLRPSDALRDAVVQRAAVIRRSAIRRGSAPVCHDTQWHANAIDATL